MLPISKASSFCEMPSVRDESLAVSAVCLFFQRIQEQTGKPHLDRMKGDGLEVFADVSEATAQQPDDC